MTDTPTQPQKTRPSLMWPITVIVASLIIGGAIFATQLSKQRSIERQVNIERQENANKEAQEKEEAETRARQLDLCLSQAESDYMDWWNRECKSQGLKEDCRLPEYNADTIDQGKKDDKANCYKQYPQ